MVGTFKRLTYNTCTYYLRLAVHLWEGQ